MTLIHKAVAPPHESRGPLEWGSWDGALAIVDFDVERLQIDMSTLECSRVFFVRYATDEKGNHPIPSIPEYDVGMPVNVARPDLPYTRTTFSLGRFGQKRHIAMGGFSESFMYKCNVSLKDMTEREHAILRRKLLDEHYIYFDTKLTAKVWEHMLGKTFDEVQDLAADLANEADRLVTRHYSANSHVASQAAWESARSRGIFTESKNGRIKWILQRRR